MIISSPSSSVVSSEGLALITSGSNSALTLPLILDFLSSSRTNGRDSEANNESPFVINF